MELRGERVTLRPLASSDVPRLVELGAEPEVVRWWPGITEGYLNAKVGGPVFAIDFEDGELVGLIQFHEEDHADYRHAGIDLFLATGFHGHGLGPEAVAVLAGHLTRDRGHHRLVIDPAADNERAIRAYEKVGFRAVGIQREYWRDGNGVWRDGLLMDLLAHELRPQP